MKQGVGLAHAKVILIGEHSVVYHLPAIALPFKALQCRVVVAAHSKLSLECDFYKGELKDAPSMFKPIQHLIEALCVHLHVNAVLITIHSTIPTSAGLGSSAALASAITQAMFAYADVPLSDDARFTWTQISETCAHGNPSGVDALTTSFDAAWWFVKGETPIPISLSLPAYLIIAQTHEQGSTKQAVEKVKDYITHHGYEHIVALGKLTEQCYHHLQTHNIEAIGQCMNQAHMLLQACGVSTPTLDSFVALAQKHGALGAKLTGGGLGGCMIALAKNQSDCEHISYQLSKHTPHVWSHHLI